MHQTKIYCTQEVFTNIFCIPDCFQIDVVANLLENRLARSSVDDQDTFLHTGFLVATELGKVLRITLNKYIRYSIFTTHRQNTDYSSRPGGSYIIMVRLNCTREAPAQIFSHTP